MARLQAGVGVAPFGIPGMPESADGTPLLARALTLDDGDNRICVVSCHCLGLYGPDSAQVRLAVCEATGLATEQVMVAATHVHSGPSTITNDTAQRLSYVEHIARAAAQVARESMTLRPARLGYATDHLPGISRVRRIVRRDGSVVTLRRAWPQYWNWATDPETVGPEDELDDLLTVVRVESHDGAPFAAIMHFTCHPIPDFFGWAARIVEENTPGLTCLILNGCFGSVDAPFEVPMRGHTQQEQLPILGDILGYRTLELLARAETSDAVRLGVARREVFLPFDPRFADSETSQGELWAGATRNGGAQAEVQCLALGDLALAGIPGEAQVSFGQRIQAVSPYALTRGVGNANGSWAYLFTPEARARGGYEPDPAFWGMVADEGLARILEAIQECLTEMRAGTEGEVS